jgi:hypothetical protein
MGVNVHEAGRNEKAFRIDLAIGSRQIVTYRNNPATRNTNICLEYIAASPICDSSATNH